MWKFKVNETDTQRWCKNRTHFGYAKENIRRAVKDETSKLCGSKMMPSTGVNGMVTMVCQEVLLDFALKNEN